MEGQEENQPAMPARVVDMTGKPFIQAEELTARLDATINACAVDHAIGYAGVFGALEQLKAQYMARVALKVSVQEPGDVLATHEAVGQLQAANQARISAEAAEAARRTVEEKPAKQSIEKRLAAQKAPTKAPRPAAKQVPKGKGVLRSVK